MKRVNLKTVQSKESVTLAGYTNQLQLQNYFTVISCPHLHVLLYFFRHKIIKCLSAFVMVLRQYLKHDQEDGLAVGSSKFTYKKIDTFFFHYTV